MMCVTCASPSDVNCGEGESFVRFVRPMKVRTAAMTPGIAFATYIVLAVALFGIFAGSSRRLDAGTRQRMRRWILREADGAQGDQA